MLFRSRAIYKNKNKEAAGAYEREKAEIKARKKADAEQDQKDAVKKYIKTEDKAWRTTQKLQSSEAKIRKQMQNVSLNEQRSIEKTGKASTKAGRELVKQLDAHLKLRNVSQKAWEEAASAYKATGKNMFDRLYRVNRFKDVALSELAYHPEDHGIYQNAKKRSYS